MPAGYHQKQVVDKQWRAVFGKFNLKLQRLAHSGNWVNMHSSRYEDVHGDGRTLVFENDMASGGVAAHDVESVNVA